MKFDPIMSGYPHLLHGGDYSPEQWLDRPDVIDADFRLAGEAGVNTFSIGIFSWAALEPEEGRFEFAWLDDIMARLAAAGMKAVLATPSGAKPNWMAAKYPEIRRVQAMGHRDHQAGRHNHCYTSPVYRAKTTRINTALATRYAGHPALGLWHISNEYSGECHCDLCKTAFRNWLQRKYGTLEALNRAWWTAFWSHTYTAWEQVDWIDGGVHGLVLDWKRFVSDQTADFLRVETAPLREYTPGVPVTINLMGTYTGLDYRRLVPYIDVVSWDAYPAYHDRDNMAEHGAYFGFLHDLNRGLKGGRPYLLMESSPSAVNWMPVNKLLRPGVHRLKSMQAIAHGSDSVQYFQWRKSRGSSEKFHGAVVDHVGHSNTRVFRDVAEVGECLKKLNGVLGCPTPSEVAVLYDWDNRWILQEAAGPVKPAGRSFYEDCVTAHHRAFWKQGVPVDVIGSQDSFDGYKLLVAPLLYLLLPGVADRLKAFVRDGGTLVGTYLTGIADENDRVFEGGWPGPLREVFGIWAEEIDYLYPDESNRLLAAPNNAAGLSGEYRVQHACDLIHAEGATVMATYGEDFYAGRPGLTRNTYGAGAAWYLAACPEQRLLDDLHGRLVRDLGIRRALPEIVTLPTGVTAQVRTDGETDYVFVLNFSRVAVQMEFPAQFRGRLIGEYRDVLTGRALSLTHHLEPYGVTVLSRPALG